MTQLDLFADQRTEWAEADRQAAQEKLDLELAPYLGPLIPMGWDASCDLQKGDLVRHLRCPECGVIDWNRCRLEIDGCLCRRWQGGPHVRLGVGLNGWTRDENGERIYAPIWTEKDGWLVPEYRHPLTGRVWEFRVFWNEHSDAWGSRKELVS